MARRVTGGWIGGAAVLGLGLGLLVPAGGTAAVISLGPAVARPEAGLTVAVEHGPPESVEGPAAGGGPMFLGVERAAGFLGVDVRALKGNRNGFGAGEFVPYLSVSYRVEPLGGGPGATGVLHPMVGPRGLRYGNNLPPLPPGRYRLTLTVEPPIRTGFGRHTDIETGVGRWWAPLGLEWSLDLAPRGRQ
jgi:hypothetical protein